MLLNRLGIRSKILVFVLVAFTEVLGSFSHAMASGAPDQLKAAYLYNFAKLTYWPSSEHSDSGKSIPLVICTSASDQFTEELIEISDKPIAGRPVQIVSLGIKSNSDFCDIVFVDKQHSDAWFRNHKKENEGQLLVGEIEGFIDQGGVINFYLDGDKLRFEVSIVNAEQRGVQISSRLLRLAKIAGAKQ